MESTEKINKGAIQDYISDSTLVVLGFKEDKESKGAVNGYAPLNEFAKVSSQYLNIINDLVTGGTTSLLSAEQGKQLAIQVMAVNTLLTSNDLNLDTVQELVDAIKTVQTSLSSMLVNDLTTGGTTKALTAEMGKTLKGLIDALAPAEPVTQITITTSVSITTDTLDANNYSQKGRNTIIDNSTNAIGITVNGGTGFNSSYLKHGTGAITFLQGEGRTLVQVDGTAILGAVGSTASISSIGTTDYLRISNV